MSRFLAAAAPPDPDDHRRTTLTSDRGFTLAELLVSVAIVGLVLAGVLGLWTTGSTTYLVGANRVEAQSSARAALALMARDIRGAGLDPRNVAATSCSSTSFIACAIVGPPATFPPTTATLPTATTFTIQNDSDGDGAIASGERISYALNGTVLERRDFAVDAAPQEIVGGLQALTFTYFDAAGTQITTLNATTVPAIRSIGIDITARPERQPAISQAGRAQVRMTERVRIRNR
jgi:prepilin-type N-terminal cleavage/methylation domain-containing protein